MSINANNISNGINSFIVPHDINQHITNIITTHSFLRKNINTPPQKTNTIHILTIMNNTIHNKTMIESINHTQQISTFTIIQLDIKINKNSKNTNNTKYVNKLQYNIEWNIVRIVYDPIHYY